MLLRKDCPTSSEIKPKGRARSASARRSAVSHQNGVPSEYVWKASSSCLLLYRSVQGVAAFGEPHLPAAAHHFISIVNVSRSRADVAIQTRLAYHAN